MAEVNNIESLTDEQIEAAYLFRKKQQKEKQENERNAYEVMKSELANELTNQAISIEAEMAKFHEGSMSKLKTFREIMKIYGELRGNSKGGFRIENEAGTVRVRLAIKQLGDFNEKADMAEEHITNFFERTLKPKDPNTFEILMELLERKKGKLEYARVLKILSYKDRYDDADWIKGCELLAESFINTGSKEYLEFEVKDGEEWRRVNTNLSSL